MKINLIQKVRGSLFLKLLVIFLAAHLIITFVSITTHEQLFRQTRFHKIKQNSINYARFLIRETGSPPDTLFAERITKKYGINMMIETPEYKWTSLDELLTFDTTKILPFDGNENVRASFQKGIHIYIKESNASYLVLMESREEGISYAAELHLTIMIITITLIIIGIFLLIRLLLKPVRDLNEGVRKLSGGDLDFEIRRRSKDEMGRLVASFNEMVRRIKYMIHAREQLMLDVSHELRSPLTRVKVALEFLEDGNVRKNISDDISEMETMITEILEGERLNSPYGGLYTQSHDICKLINETISEFNDKKPGIKVAGLSGKRELKLDPDRIKIVFRNILSNAFKYSPENGYSVEVSLKEKEDEVIIEIQDFGQGIPVNEIPYIFEPFYRVDKSRSKKTGGYGLGLSLSKKIVEAHNGQIEINSQVGVGTTVFLKFKK
ncbi:MAG: sensor histidine kinase [Calditrichaceae bacterium]